MRAYELRHVVSFEETNFLGNVYYVNHLRWQGRCREMFLREHTPEILAALNDDLRLITVRCSCEYLAELNAFDEVIIRMRLASLTQSKMTLGFEYWRPTQGDEKLVARGEQEIACMKKDGAELVATPVPDALRIALEQYGGS